MNCTLAIIQLYHLNYKISIYSTNFYNHPLRYHDNSTPTYHRLKKISRYVFCGRNYDKRYLQISIMMPLCKKLTSTPHVFNITPQGFILSYLQPYFKAPLQCGRLLRNRISQSSHSYFSDLRRHQVTLCSNSITVQYVAIVTLVNHMFRLFYNTKVNSIAMLYFGTLTSNPKTVFVTHMGVNRDSIPSSTTLSKFVNLYHALPIK